MRSAVLLYLLTASLQAAIPYGSYHLSQDDLETGLLEYRNRAISNDPNFDPVVLERVMLDIQAKLVRSGLRINETEIEILERLYDYELYEEGEDYLVLRLYITPGSYDEAYYEYDGRQFNALEPDAIAEELATRGRRYLIFPFLLGIEKLEEGQLQLFYYKLDAGDISQERQYEIWRWTPAPEPEP